MRYKDHGVRYIVDRLREEGAISSLTREGGVQTLHTWIKRGYLKLRMKPPGMWYRANDKEIDEIIQDFTPGGEGWWEPGKKQMKELELKRKIDGEVTESLDSLIAQSDSTYMGFAIPSVKPEGSLAY